MKHWESKKPQNFHHTKSISPSKGAFHTKADLYLKLLTCFQSPDFYGKFLLWKSTENYMGTIVDEQTKSENRPSQRKKSLTAKVCLVMQQTFPISIDREVHKLKQISLAGLHYLKINTVESLRYKYLKQCLLPMQGEQLYHEYTACVK